MKTTLHYYRTGPVDNWEGWLTVEEFVEILHGLKIAREPALNLQTFLVFLAEAVGSARTDVGWEGDITGEHFFVAKRSGAVPSSLLELVLGWKQSNNGTTFFVSGRPLDQAAIDDASGSCQAPIL